MYICISSSSYIIVIVCVYIYAYQYARRVVQSRSIEPGEETQVSSRCIQYVHVFCFACTAPLLCTRSITIGSRWNIWPTIGYALSVLFKDSVSTMQLQDWQFL